MIAGILDEFFGVPTHPLAVHAPVVLVPLGCVAALVLAVRADWRRRIGWVWPAIVFALVASLFVAKQSGEALEASGNVLGDVEHHTELANTTWIMSLVWFALVLGLAVAERLKPSRPSTRSLSADGVGGTADIVTVVWGVVAAAAAVITTIWLVRTGHAGARSRWVG